ncbi:MAG TPA: TonB family protein, partial [Hymenobacter sp.]
IVTLPASAQTTATKAPISSAQPKDTSFFDNNWHHVSRADAVYFGWVTPSDTVRCLIQDFYVSGEKQMEATGLLGPPVRKDGLATYYYRSGTKKAAGQYVNGKKEGTWQYWRDTGELARQVSYKQGIDTSRVVTYVRQMPAFPGGNEQFKSYLATHVHYPADAPRNITGKVFVEFIVGTDGSITNTRIVKGSIPVFNAEAIRVIANMPHWKPAKQNGKPIAVRFVVSINFQS